MYLTDLINVKHWRPLETKPQFCKILRFSKARELHDEKGPVMLQPTESPWEAWIHDRRAIVITKINLFQQETCFGVPLPTTQAAVSRQGRGPSIWDIRKAFWGIQIGWRSTFSQLKTIRQLALSIFMMLQRTFQDPSLHQMLKKQMLRIQMAINGHYRTMNGNEITINRFEWRSNG